jgi:hypothetical protein
VFAQKGHLNRHAKTHGGAAARTFGCHLCPKVSYFISQFNVLICNNWCDAILSLFKTYTDKWHLRRHVVLCKSRVVIQLTQDGMGRQEAGETVAVPLLSTGQSHAADCDAQSWKCRTCQQAIWISILFLCFLVNRSSTCKTGISLQERLGNPLGNAHRRETLSVWSVSVWKGIFPEEWSTETRQDPSSCRRASFFQVRHMWKGKSRNSALRSTHHLTVIAFLYLFVMWRILPRKAVCVTTWRSIRERSRFNALAVTR